jgi:hypothetical protein
MYECELCRATKPSQSNEAADGAVHSCNLSRDITPTVHWNGTEFMVAGFVLVCSSTVAGVKYQALFKKVKLALTFRKKKRKMQIIYILKGSDDGL